MSSSTVTACGPGLRLFTREGGQPRSRRATDVIALVSSVLALVIVSAIAEPQPGYIRILSRVATGIPSLLDGLWQFGSDLAVVYAIALVVAVIARRRWAIARDAAFAAVATALVCIPISRAVHGSWFDAWDVRSGPPERFPLVELAIVAAIVMTAQTYLILPIRRLGAFVLTTAAVSAVALGSTLPLGAVAALLIAFAAASAARLVFGSTEGRPALDDVADGLAELGVSAGSLDEAERQPTGLFLVDAVTHEQRPLVVKVYGRDAHDTAVVVSTARAVWYRQVGGPLRYGRLRQVEHEALLTVLAAQAGVHTDEVVAVGATRSGDAMLALGRVGTPVEAESVDAPARADELWRILEQLHERGIAHGRVDRDNLVLVDGELGIVDMRRGSLACTPPQRCSDRAQALVTSLELVDEQVALDAAVRALGADGVAEVLPYLQPAALTPAQRALVHAGDIDLDRVRQRAAASIGQEPPRLEPLRRVTAASVMRVVLPAVVLVALISAVAGLDVDELTDVLAEATWWLVVAAFLVAQLPRFAQALSTLGASPVPLPLGPVYALQLAMSYIGIAVPSSAGRVALNIRFFQRHGVPAGGALAAGAVDGAALFATQAVILALLLTFGQFSVDLDVSSSANAAIPLLLTVVAIVVIALCAVAAVRRWRTAVVQLVRRLTGEAVQAVRGVQSPRRLGLLIGGNLASEILFALALGTFCRALGTSVGIDELLMVNIGVSLLASIAPVPGGIGVAEGGLTWGLVQIGVPEETAFAAVLLHRISTFYLPPIWGYRAFRWLERNDHL